MAEAGGPGVGRREFVQGALSGAALAAVPALAAAAVASFVDFLYAFG